MLGICVLKLRLCVCEYIHGLCVCCLCEIVIDNRIQKQEATFKNHQWTIKFAEQALNIQGIF